MSTHGPNSPTGYHNYVATNQFLLDVRYMHVHIQGNFHFSVQGSRLLVPRSELREALSTDGVTGLLGD
jgi:hypothetical protein